MLVASAPNVNVIQHLEYNNSHLYFIVGGTLNEIFLYFVKEQKPLGGNFITYNSYSSQIGSSEKVVHEPNVSSFPVVEIKSQDLLPEELLGRLNDL